jgi:hypothetical protein
MRSEALDHCQATHSQKVTLESLLAATVQNWLFIVMMAATVFFPVIAQHGEEICVVRTSRENISLAEHKVLRKSALITIPSVAHDHPNVVVLFWSVRWPGAACVHPPKYQNMHAHIYARRVGENDLYSYRTHGHRSHILTVLPRASNV